MKFIKFTIKNFKGIKSLELDFTKHPQGKIFPLVGLNESGKTTILEAINFFQEDVDDEKKHELLHKKDSGNFTGAVEVAAELLLEKKDISIIADFLEQNLLQIENNPEKISITKRYEYDNALFSKSQPLWSFTPELNVKTKQQKKYRDLHGKNEDLWLSLFEEVKKHIPKILYFPDFLFEFPTKIYLENIDSLLIDEKGKEIQERYKQIIDDVLHSIDSNYNLNDFLTKLKAPDGAQQEASSQIKQDISSALNQKIITPWEEIFSGPKKDILIESGKDNFGYYLQMRVKEGASGFFISERSVGFRWFFCFILFTEFRTARLSECGEYMFLFDEPASNLHENSQGKLLNLFEKLTGKAKIIYSTHSPYLINPIYILSSFIVRDVGRDEESDFNFKQDIQVFSYKQFASQYPGEETHFKPILDVLEFRPIDFDLTDNIIFLEGKSDYYTFKWIKDVVFSDTDFDFKLYPGAGVNKYENIFREYLAHSKKFTALFDDDGAGKKAKNKYIKDISQELESYVFTLKDVDPAFSNFTTEHLFDEKEKLDIQKNSFPDSSEYEKGKFNTAIQELFIKKEKFELSENTKEKFKKIFEFMQDKFNNLEK